MLIPQKRALIVLILGYVQAEGEGRWYVNPAVGFQSFDSDRKIDDETTYSIGGEYRYNDSWASELRYLDTSAESDFGPDVDLSQYYLDGLYYFRGQAQKWQPFVVGGIGHAEFDSKLSDEKETQANIGGGVRYLLNDNWSLRADARAIFGFDDDTTDSLVNLGISYSFGSSKKAAAPAEPMSTDDDNDGVDNSSDQCPNTTAGVAVDSTGCEQDSDGDGVVDSQDHCLSTPAGATVNEKGCILVPAAGISFDLSIRFAHDSDDVAGYDQAAVDKAVAYLRDNDDATLLVEGHTDSSGPAAYNKALSERRAAAVAKFISEKYSIDSTRVSSEGFGEELPIADDATAEGRAANRLVAKVRSADK